MFSTRQVKSNSKYRLHAFMFSSFTLPHENFEFFTKQKNNFSRRLNTVQHGQCCSLVYSRTSTSQTTPVQDFKTAISESNASGAVLNWGFGQQNIMHAIKAGYNFMQTVKETGCQGSSTKSRAALMSGFRRSR